MVGIDEVGRGCLAGPLLVVAARQKSDNLPDGLKDSKLLSRKVRNMLFIKIVETCDFGEGWVEAAEIDNLGLASAMRLGVKRALQNLPAKVDERIIMDGNVNYCPGKYKNTETVIDGDQLVPIVSAASIYAKVTRDRYMSVLSLKHPTYKFETNVGYGTPEHLSALENCGPLHLVHRVSFEPIRQMRLL